MEQFVKAVRKLPNKLKSKLKRKIHHKRVSEDTMPHNSADHKSHSIHIGEDNSSVQGNSNEERSSTVAKLSDIDIGVNLTTKCIDDEGIDGSDNMSSQNKSIRPTVKDGDFSKPHKTKTFHRKISSNGITTSHLQTLSGNSLQDSSAVSENQMRKNSEKCCTCKNKDLFPSQFDETDTMVHLTKLVCTRSKIWGRVLVNNICFEKRIYVRWSHDSWESFYEQQAIFEEPSISGSDPQQSGKDAFTFEIQRPQDCETVELAVRYCVCDEEFWDNNGGTNYLAVTGTVY